MIVLKQQQKPYKAVGGLFAVSSFSGSCAQVGFHKHAPNAFKLAHLHL